MIANDEPKECFVISPIGEDGSATRIRADKVLRNIIQPALEACGYYAIRADEIADPGVITSQIIEHIVQAPLVIADLSDHNPNVFYELALRHAIKKPIVLIIQQGQTIPFDIAQMRTIDYGWDVEHANRSKLQIIKQIKSLATTPSTPPTPLSVALDFINVKTQSRSALVVATNKHYQLATELVKSAEKQIVLCQRTSTILLGAERGRIPEESFAEALREKLAAGVHVYHLIHEESCMADVWRMPGKFEENLGKIPNLKNCYIGRYNGDKPIPRLLMVDDEVLGSVFDIDQMQYYEVIEAPGVETASQNAIRYITDRALEEFQLSEFLAKLKLVRNAATKFYGTAEKTNGDGFAEYFAAKLREKGFGNIITEYGIGESINIPLASLDKQIGFFFDSVSIADESKQRQRIWQNHNLATSKGWKCYFLTRTDLLTKTDELPKWFAEQLR